MAEVTQLPADMEVEMLSELFSERSEINDVVEVRLLEPINLPMERLFIPIDSIVKGKVVEVQEFKRGLKRGKVKVIFEYIRLPNGFMLATSGFLMGSNRKRLFRAKEAESSNRKRLFRAKEAESSNNDSSSYPSDEPPRVDEVKGRLSIRDTLFAAGKVGVGALLGGPIGAATAAETLVFDKGGKVRLTRGQRVYVHLEQIAFINQQLDVQGRIGLPPAFVPQPRLYP